MESETEDKDNVQGLLAEDGVMEEWTPFFMLLGFGLPFIIAVGIVSWLCERENKKYDDAMAKERGKIRWKCANVR